MIWDQLTSPQIKTLSRTIPVVLPIAATEQHGPHLPLATDHIIGRHFAHKLHEQLPEQVLILPALPVGCSEHHMAFVGTLTFSHHTFATMIVEILASVAAHGFTNLVILNAHGGNQAIGQVALEMFGARYPECRVVMATWWRLASQALLDITETGPGGVGHACEFETSLLLHIAPELVQREQITAGGNQPTFEWAEADMLRGANASLFRAMDVMTTNGVYGDPTAASAAKGAEVEAAVIQALKAMILSLS